MVVVILEGGLMLGCQAVDATGRFRFRYLFSGFGSGRAGQLALVGVIFVIAHILVFFLVALMLFIQLGGDALQQILEGQGDEVADILDDKSSLLLLDLLVGAALSLPVVMASWMAPAIIVIGKMDAVPAMILSFRACLANIVPFLVYGVVVLILSIVAAIPFLLGFAVFVPMMIASIYITYKDVLSA